MILQAQAASIAGDETSSMPLQLDDGTDCVNNSVYESGNQLPTN